MKKIMKEIAVPVNNVRKCSVTAQGWEALDA